ncbi:MAG: nucleoside monophosphate kinase, partial [Bacteroidales bacterium]|nr:nucleoside monophosphate kinase [Bacteroidales bacterium]
VIKNRLKEYYDKTLPVLDFYKERGNYFSVNGLQSIEKVNSDIEDLINKVQSTKLVNIVMFGYPGSGRGSIGKALAEKYNLEFVATGAMLDEEINNNSEIGNQIKQLYENGELVPDEIVIKLIEKKIDNTKNAKGFIFKGYPRTLVQSYILDGILKKRNSVINKVIEIEVDTLELINRLDKRSKTDSKMPYDSSTEKIVKRLQEHKEKTIPVIEKYKEIHNVSIIDGMDTFENVFKKVCDEIDTSFKNLK